MDIFLSTDRRVCLNALHCPSKEQACSLIDCTEYVCMLEISRRAKSGLRNCQIHVPQVDWLECQLGRFGNTRLKTLSSIDCLLRVRGTSVRNLTLFRTLQFVPEMRAR